MISPLPVNRKRTSSSNEYSERNIPAENRADSFVLFYRSSLRKMSPSAVTYSAIVRPPDVSGPSRENLSSAGTVNEAFILSPTLPSHTERAIRARQFTVNANGRDEWREINGWRTGGEGNYTKRACQTCPNSGDRPFNIRKRFQGTIVVVVFAPRRFLHSTAVDAHRTWGVSWPSFLTFALRYVFSFIALQFRVNVSRVRNTITRVFSKFVGNTPNIYVKRKKPTDRVTNKHVVCDTRAYLNAFVRRARTRRPRILVPTVMNVYAKITEKSRSARPSNDGFAGDIVIVPRVLHARWGRGGFCFFWSGPFERDMLLFSLRKAKTSNALPREFNDYSPRDYLLVVFFFLVRSFR